MLPAFGAVHAAHLAIPDLVEVIGESPLLQRSMKHNCRLISGSKYAPFVCSNLRDLLEEIILDIFQRSTNPARLFEVTGSFLNRTKEVSLFVLGSTAYLLPLRRSLDVQGIKVAVLTTAPSLQTPELRGGSGLVAIVGMSGQFPGSKSVDELWDSIMRQEEFHKKVLIRFSEIWFVVLTSMFFRFRPIASTSTLTWMRLARLKLPLLLHMVVF